MKGKKGSITETLALLWRSGATSMELSDTQTRLLQERVVGLEDWINEQAEIDKLFVVFMLETAAKGLYSQLNDREKIILSALREYQGTAVIATLSKEG